VRAEYTITSADSPLVAAIQVARPSAAARAIVPIVLVRALAMGVSPGARWLTTEMESEASLIPKMCQP